LRKRHLTLALAGLALLVLAAWAAVNSGSLRRSWILRFNMHEAAPGVLVSDALTPEQERSFVEMAAAGRARAEEWFGPLQNRAQVVVVHDNDLRLDLGMPPPFAWNPLDQGNCRVYIGPKGLNVDVMAHGIAHAEIKHRTGLDQWHRVPAWFDEGLATQVDLRPFLNDPQAAAAPPLPPAQIQALRSWDAYTGEHAESNLVLGKQEVTRWLARSGGRAAADQLLAAVRAGEDFDAALARLESAGGQ